MNGQINFDCHEFLDNTSLCILEISFVEEQTRERRHHWMLVNKSDGSVRSLKLRTKDGSSSIQECFFNLGFLKYDAKSGVFIQAHAKDLHHLERKSCKDIPQAYLLAITAYLKAETALT